MGVPKFFRWISERYPAISQLIADSRIPEFDCFYLDMNGIIHNCTHNDDDSVTARMTEEAMFRNIFNYIEHLFNSIKPKQLFFMAVDGVAPRAKMNQQRSRRFRTALDAEKAREKAVREGLEMPKEEPFDSNCITPGTEFMAKLSEQLKYFVHRKVSEDSNWQGIEIVLSGHEVPGEGEHKIMEYIRHAKSQPGYESNRRHCLYGLDADLIMLGLLSHDPHFCLLREEVTFGRGNGNKTKELQHQKFFLLHLCMVREYLELEFQELKRPGALPFEFDLERIIDDFILLAFFVGNDFLPNLPHLHINQGALALVFEVYKETLSEAGGYINDRGTVDFKRLGHLLKKLESAEKLVFDQVFEDKKGPRKFKNKPKFPPQPLGEFTITPEQKQLYQSVRNFLAERFSTLDSTESLTLKSLSTEDRKFVQDLASKLNLTWSTPEDDFGDRYLELQLPVDLSEINSSQELKLVSDPLLQIYKKYDQAHVLDSAADEKKEQDAEEEYRLSYETWKDEYYQAKLGWKPKDQESLKELARNYVEGLQWVLYYYYRGVASWPWFYRYHYAPMISDVHLGFDANLDFDLGAPFRPFEQLMGVLPDRSKKIVPTAYHSLMTDPESDIYDFYPRDFELDMNDKKMEWEAVVKIPFIDENRLLKAMATRESQLTEDERRRNSFGYAIVFTYDPNADYVYTSPLPGIFYNVQNCHCVENMFEPPPMEGLEIYHGLVQGVQMGQQAMAGFPSLKTTDFVGRLENHGICVFQHESHNPSIVVTLRDYENKSKASYMMDKLGKRVYVGYPFLMEARISKISDELFDYYPTPTGKPNMVAHAPREHTQFQRSAERLQNTYSKKLGIITGEVEAIAHVELLKGMKKMDDGSIIKEFAYNPLLETEFPVQTIVEQVYNLDARYLERSALPIEEEFPLNSIHIFLGKFAYGQPLEVTGYSDDGRLNVELYQAKVPDEYLNFGRKLCEEGEKMNPYFRLLEVADKVKLHPEILNAIVSTVFVRTGSNPPRVNLGLNLKFEFHKQKILHFTRHHRGGWEFSQDAVDFITEFTNRFPQFIERLVKVNRQGRSGARLFSSMHHQSSDLFPGPEGGQELSAIRNWIKAETSKRKLVRVPLDAQQLDSIQVGLLEAKVANIKIPSQQACTLRRVPRHAVLKSVDAEQRLAQQKFQLGDRVEYVLRTGAVPIGRLGTVVGLTQQPHVLLVDVVFDMDFESGTTLDGRCSKLRGQSLPSTSLLNLTAPQVIASNQASDKSQAASGPQGRGGTGRGRGNDRSVRGGKTYRNAPAPPPLKGSFSAAARGRVGSNPSWRPPQGSAGGSGGDAINSLVAGIQKLGNGEANRPINASVQTNAAGKQVIPVSQLFATPVPTGPAGENFNAVPPPASYGHGGRGGRGGARGGSTRGLRGRGRGRV